MYGIINKAIEDLITHHYGEEKWQAIKLRSGVDVDFFIGSEPYDDDVTYKLAGAAADEMNIPLEEVLVAFGEWWVLNTTKKKYGNMMAAGGSNLRDFLVNLPSFHNRVMMLYPKLSPPEFKVSHVANSSLYLHYMSKRPGLKQFVKGLVQGLGKYYETPVTVEIIESRDAGHAHEIYKIGW